MDGQNRFDGPRTYLLIRLEYLLALIVCIAAAVIHIGQIRWMPFIGLFAYIDLIGYIPGAIAYRRNEGKISPIYYILYNTTHGALFNAAVVGVWILTIGPEWALLAIPIHLCGDRALFGNFLKPFGTPFEPRAIPAFVTLENEVKRELNRYFGAEPEIPLVLGTESRGKQR